MRYFSPIEIADILAENRFLKEENDALRKELSEIKEAKRYTKPRKIRRKRVMRADDARAIVNGLKRPCQRCGIFSPIEFHHRNPAEKVVSVAKMADGMWTREQIEQEAAKCDCLCPTCHMAIHRGT